MTTSVIHDILARNKPSLVQQCSANCWYYKDFQTSILDLMISSAIFLYRGSSQRQLQSILMILLRFCSHLFVLVLSQLSRLWKNKEGFQNFIEIKNALSLQPSQLYNHSFYYYSIPSVFHIFFIFLPRFLQYSIIISTIAFRHHLFSSTVGFQHTVSA